MSDVKFIKIKCIDIISKVKIIIIKIYLKFVGESENKI